MLDDTPDRIGDYQVLGVLGAGGMGKVYKVRNVLTDRVEAMKILLPDLASRRDLADRFLREIKLLAGLNHPNIASLHTALTWNNQLAMIMEYVEGITLAMLVKQGPLSPADAINYTDQVLAALTYAHGLGIIHRDIKPANMMLTPAGIVKLMDFGIARSQSDPSLTATGATVGSLHYMAPEQMRGEPVDMRSDIYSLGVSLYELVTGVRPFQADSDVGVMAAHLTKTPPPPIEVRHDLSAALNSIILMAMAKDPAQRFQTAGAFCNALKIAATAPSAPISAPVQMDHGATMTITDTPAIGAISAALAGSRADRGAVQPAMHHEGITEASAALGQPSVAAEADVPSIASALPAAPSAAAQPVVAGTSTPQQPVAASAAGAQSAPEPPISSNAARVPSVLEMSAARRNRTGLYLGAVFVLIMALIVGAIYAKRRHGPSTTTVAAANPATGPERQPTTAPAAATKMPTTSPSAPAPTATTPAPAAASPHFATANQPSAAVPPANSVVASTPTANSPGAAGRPANSSARSGGKPGSSGESRREGSRLTAGIRVPDAGARTASNQHNISAETRSAKPPQQQVASATPEPVNQIDQLQHDYDLLTSRVESVNASLDGLMQSQGAQGLGLRGDIASARLRMRRFMTRARSAIDAQDAPAARRFLDLADSEVTGLEKFLGR